MKTSRLKIAEVIAERTLKDFEPKKLAKQVAAYLLSEGRASELDSLIRDIIDYRAERGILEVSVTTAHELSTQIQAEIKQLSRGIRPKTKKVILDEYLDKKLIGGVRLRLANQQLDLSLRAKLDHFKQLTNAGKA